VVHERRTLVSLTVLVFLYNPSALGPRIFIIVLFSELLKGSKNHTIQVGPQSRDS